MAPVPHQDQPEGHEPGPDDDAEQARFGYACQCCGARLEALAETCPGCGADLGSQFSVTYRVSTPAGARKVALVALVGLTLLVVLAVVALVSQMLTGTAAGPPQAP